MSSRTEKVIKFEMETSQGVTTDLTRFFKGIQQQNTVTEITLSNYPFPQISFSMSGTPEVIAKQLREIADALEQQGDL